MPDLSIYAQTPEGWSTNGLTYTYTYTVPPDLNSEVVVGSATVSDTQNANNRSLADDQIKDVSFTIQTDSIAPTILSIKRQTPTAEQTNAGSVTFEVKFSEAVNLVGISDFSPDTSGGVTGTHWTVGQPDATDYTTYEVTVLVSNGDGTLGLKLGNSLDIKDLADNDLSTTLPTGDNNQTYTIDNTGPQNLRRSASPNPVEAGGTVTIALLFDESMDDSKTPSIIFTGQADSYLIQSGTGTWSQTTSANDTYTISYDVKADSPAISGVHANIPADFTDKAGNAFTPIDVIGLFSIAQDSTAPQVSSVSFYETNTSTTIDEINPGDTFDVVVTFNEAMKTDDANKPTLTFYDGNNNDVTSELVQTPGRTGSWSADAVTYRVAYTAPTYTASDTLASSIAVQSVEVVGGEDANGNDLDTDNDTADAALTLIENTAPTVSIALAPAERIRVEGDKLTLSLRFSESMDTAQTPTVSFNPTGLPLTLDTASSGWAETISPNDTYNVVYTVGQVTTEVLGVEVSVSAGPLDLAGNAFSPALAFPNMFSLVKDQEAPTITSIERSVPSDASTNADEVTFLVAFSEGVTNVDDTDFTADADSGVSTGTLSVTDAGDTDAATWAVKIAGVDGDGELRLKLAAGQDITDLAAIPNDLTNTTPTGTNQCPSSHNLEQLSV